jgi:hypothetical protein
MRVQAVIVIPGQSGTGGTNKFVTGDFSAHTK